MLRLFLTASAFLVAAAPAGARPDPKAKAFAADVELLTGTWIGPKTSLGPGTTGPLVLKLEFEKDNAVGRATFLSFFSKSGIFMKTGPAFVAEIKEKGKKRVLVLSETKDGKNTEIGEIAYAVKGDGLRLEGRKKVLAEKRGHPLEMSGDWVRRKADKK